MQGGRQQTPHLPMGMSPAPSTGFISGNTSPYIGSTGIFSGGANPQQHQPTSNVMMSANLGPQPNLAPLQSQQQYDQYQQQSSGVGPSGPVVNNEPKLHRSWNNDAWPPSELNEVNILDYFCHPTNCFYDKSSVNEHIKMQNYGRPLMDCPNLLDRFASMEGIQYVVVTAQPPLFVILKQHRRQRNEVIPLSYYHVINGTVYQSPDMHTLIHSRLLHAIRSLKLAFREAGAYSQFNVARGYYWLIPAVGRKNLHSELASRENEEEGEPESKPETARSTLFQRTRVDRLLALLSEKFPPPSQSSNDDQQHSAEDSTSAVQPPRPLQGVVQKAVQGGAVGNSNTQMSSKNSNTQNTMKRSLVNAEESSANAQAPHLKRVKLE